MVVSTLHEVHGFFAAIVFALAMCVFGDAVHAVGTFAKRRSVADFIGWCTRGAAAFFGWLYFLKGELRIYMAVSALLTAILYLLLVERYVFRMFLCAIRTICVFFEIILKILLTPQKFLCKIINKYVNRAKNKFCKKVKDEYEEKAYIQD